MNLPNLEELSFLTVLALPKASRMGLALSSCCSSSPCNETELKADSGKFQSWENKALHVWSQIRESSRLNNQTRKGQFTDMYQLIKPQAYIWVPFLGHWKKNKSPHITIISCASQSNEFEPFSTATDKSQGLPVRPTEIEDINNKSQTELHTRTGQIIPHTSILGSGCSNEQFSVKTKGKEINGRKVYLHHNITYWAIEAKSIC